MRRTGRRARSSTSRSTGSATRSASGGVICGLSGGVDSATAAALVHEAVGDQLTCVLVDHGLLRKGEADQVVETFREGLGIKLIHVDARERFLARLAGDRRAGAQAQDHRRGVHPRLRGGGPEASRRQPPRPGHALLRRDRVRRRHRRRHDQVAPQCRRPPRGPRLRSRRAAADAVQGRGPRRRRRARPLRPDGLAPAVSRPRPRDPDRRRRGQRGAPRDPSRGRRRSSRRRSAPPASTATSGSPSACSRSSARSASRAMGAPTPTRS